MKIKILRIFVKSKGVYLTTHSVVNFFFVYKKNPKLLFPFRATSFLGARGHPPGAYSARVFHLCPFASIGRLLPP